MLFNVYMKPRVEAVYQENSSKGMELGGINMQRTPNSSFLCHLMLGKQLLPGGFGYALTS